MTDWLSPCGSARCLLEPGDGADDCTHGLAWPHLDRSAFAGTLYLVCLHRRRLIESLRRWQAGRPLDADKLDPWAMRPG